MYHDAIFESIYLIYTYHCDINGNNLDSTEGEISS